MTSAFPKSFPSSIVFLERWFSLSTGASSRGLRGETGGGGGVKNDCRWFRPKLDHILKDTPGRVAFLKFLTFVSLKNTNES